MQDMPVNESILKCKASQAVLRCLTEIQSELNKVIHLHFVNESSTLVKPSLIKICTFETALTGATSNGASGVSTRRCWSAGIYMQPYLIIHVC
jgi:hypothetical protein